MTPRASVLIVGYRAYDELAACLASVARHEPEAEVVVVDNAADPVRGRALCSAHPGVRYIAREDNPGFGTGMNMAARAARGKYFLLVNPDVELSAPIVGALIATLDSTPGAGIVGGRIRETNGDIQPSARSFPDWTTAFGGRTSWLTRLMPRNPLTRRNLIPQAQLTMPTPVDWVTGALMLMPRHVFEALGGFDERFFLYWEDADFCRRALDRGWLTIFEPRVDVVHHGARASAHAPFESSAAFHRSVFRYYWKHGGTIARALSPLVALGLLFRYLLRIPRAARRA